MLKLNQPTLGKDGWEVRREITPKRGAWERLGEMACSGIHVFVRIGK